MRLVYLDSARDDLIDILHYIAGESGDADVALAFVDRIRSRVRHLSDLGGTLGSARPELGNDLRSTPQQGYVIFFRYRPDALEVVNILHGNRDVAHHSWPDCDLP